MSGEGESSDDGEGSEQSSDDSLFGLNLLDRLKNLIEAGDISIDVDIQLIENLIDNSDNSENTEVHLHVDENEEFISGSPEENRADIDLGVLSEDDRRKVRNEVSDLVRSQENRYVLADTGRNERDAVASGEQDERVEETVAYFTGLIHEHHLEALESALKFRGAWEQGSLSQEDQRTWKNQISSNHELGKEITNLCTGGYFDEGGYLRELSQEMRKDPRFSAEDFKQEFEEIVRYQPFTVFVGRQFDDSDDLEEEVLETLRERERYGVDMRFIDLRGMGDDNEEIIHETVEKLDHRFGGLETDEEYPEGKGDLRVRIFTERVDAERL